MEPNIIFNIHKSNKPVKKILVIRLQAMGDVLLTLPLIQDLRSKLPPDTEIDLLTREEMNSIPKQTVIFNRVYSLAQGRNTKKQFICFLILFPKLFLKKYDILIDLQNHKLTHYMRIMLRIKTYSVFDKWSSKHALVRYQNTINVLPLPKVEFTKLSAFKQIDINQLFQKFGLVHGEQYIVINPAGAFENRNWSLDRYVELCLTWQNKVDSKIKFVILGVNALKHKASYLKSKLGDLLIDLTGRTQFFEAIHILRHVKLVISEDSGLMHAAYVVGAPTIGILGSSRSDWMNPELHNTFFFTSDDLPCGNCMLFKCKFDDIKCMDRLGYEDVLNAAILLLERTKH